MSTPMRSLSAESGTIRLGLIGDNIARSILSEGN